MGRGLAVVAVLAAVARADVREKVKKTKKYAEDTGFDWSQTSDGCGTFAPPRATRDHARATVGPSATTTRWAWARPRTRPSTK